MHCAERGVVLFRSCGGCFVLVAGLLLAGCDQSGLGRIVPVKGTVSLDGKPVPSGSLLFRPDAAKGNTSKFEPAATINSDGSYSLFTAEREGAPPGWYKVSVVAQELNAKDPYAPAKSLVPTKYNDPETSGISVEVVEQPAAGAYDLKLTR